MAVDLADFVDSLRREITPLGTALFAGTSDEVLVGYMIDAFWEAKLDGFLADYTSDEDGVIRPLPPVTKDMPRTAIALVALYAGIKILRVRILNTNTASSIRAKAGPVEFEQESQNSAQVLAEMLRQLKEVKARILEDAAHGVTDVLVIDAFSARLFNTDLYNGAPELTGGF